MKFIVVTYRLKFEKCEFIAVVPEGYNKHPECSPMQLQDYAKAERLSIDPAVAEIFKDDVTI